MKILLRLGSDVTIKSDKIRTRFVSRLMENIVAALESAGVEAKIERLWSRLFLEVAGDDGRALDVLTRVYGLSSFSPVERECDSSLQSITNAAVETFRGAVAGRTFAVRARRVGKHDYDSLQLMRTVGAALLPFAAGVDLDDPEVEVQIEVRERAAYLYRQQIRGPSGLPLGVSGKVLCLLSGGFDSAVAAWMMQKRGLEMEYLFCNLAGSAYERSVVTIAKFLASEWSYGSRPRLHVVDFQEIAAHLRERVKPSYAQVLLKRFLYRAAEQVARMHGCKAILTGECMGQVSSQTLTNLCTIEQVATLPIFRPLIAFDKDEITKLARRIGSFDLCSAVQEYCQLVPERPVTACTAARAAYEEARVDLGVLDVALAGRRMLQLQDLGASDLVTPYLHTTSIPKDAVVIDCRPATHFDAWHYDGALNLELHDLLARYKALDKGKTYVLYCPVGLQSAVAAEKMQRSGYLAYSFKGGIKALGDYARK